MVDLEICDMPDNIEAVVVRMKQAPILCGELWHGDDDASDLSQPLQANAMM